MSDVQLYLYKVYDSKAQSTRHWSIEKEHWIIKQSATVGHYTLVAADEKNQITKKQSITNANTE